MKIGFEDNAFIRRSDYPNADYLKLVLKDTYNAHQFVDFERVLDPYCDRVLVDTRYGDNGEEVISINPSKCPRNRNGHCSECPHLVHHIYITAWCAKSINPMVIPV